MNTQNNELFGGDKDHVMNKLTYNHLIIKHMS